jgi:lipoprotein-anchoring transpeptidase ErfK/SrfK
VKSGDNLISIAKRFNTTVPAIMKINEMKNDNLIQVGIKLKISTARFSIDIGVEDQLAYLLCDGYIVKQYPIATGLSDKPIPTGEFLIISKEKNPTWSSPDNTIPTGDLRDETGMGWIGIENEEMKKHKLGIYGTSDLKTIGQAVSDGYIWLRNEDVEELLALMSVNDTVRIVERLETRVWYSWVEEINDAYDKIVDKNKQKLTSQK